MPAECLAPVQSRTGSAQAGVRRLRIAQVVRSLDTGGQEVLCARLVRHLGAERVDSLVVSLQGGGWLSRGLEGDGFDVRCLNAGEGWQPALVTRLARLFREAGVDGVHCHNRNALLYGGLASFLAPGTRLFYTKHGASHWEDRATAAIGRLLLRRSRAVVAVSADIADGLRAGRWVVEPKLHTVLNGVDTAEFRPREDREQVRRELGLSPEDRVVGTVARLAPEKDQEGLLRAFALLREWMPEALLLLVGDGPLRGRLEQLAAELRVANRVRFLGERTDVARLLGAMDLFTLPSRTEGTSLTLLEAMATGLPVVATAVGGTPEVVEDGRSGRLVPASCPPLLAEALGSVLAEPAGAAEMGRAGREIVQSRYSLDAMVHRYAGLYRAACRG